MVSPFQRFLALTEWLFAQTGQTSGIAQDRLCELLFRYLVEALAMPAASAQALLASDYARQGKSLPLSIQRHTQARVGEGTAVTLALPRRQRRHRRADE